jgi:hypothetical protein
VADFRPAKRKILERKNFFSKKVLETKSSSFFDFKKLVFNILQIKKLKNKQN